MGLSSSQARLLSLTSRQHSLECDAQRLMANKLRLANESDRLYQKYTEALDETTIKTLKTDTETGTNYWVDGSLNNLLGYGTDANITGTTFFVQKMDDGKLYLPAYVGETYDSIVAAGKSAKGFAEAFGVTYTSVDHNEDVLINYTNAINSGWDKLLGNTEAECNKKYREYVEACEYDGTVHAFAYSMKTAIPTPDGDGIYKLKDTDKSSVKLFLNTLSGTTGSRGLLGEEHLHDVYSDTEVEIMISAINLMSSLCVNYPEDTEEVDGNKTTAKINRVSEVSASRPGHEYVKRSSSKYSMEFTQNDYFAMMMNGGTRSYNYDETTRITYSNPIFGSPSENTVQKTDSYNIYDTTVLSYSSSTKTASQLLSEYSAQTGVTMESFGQALKYMFDRAYASSHYVDTFYATNNLTNDDIVHYQDWLQIKAARELYTPDIEFVPDDPAKAKHYEQIFEAIQAAGGWEALDDDRAKSASWVTNMVKNAQVILTTWDDENKILSKTSGTLHTNLREQTNQLKINIAEQEFETELEKVNQKDARIDKKLSQLETERSAISSEISSIKTIIKANIETNFKLFS